MMATKVIILLIICGSALGASLYEDCSKDEDCLAENSHCPQLTRICECKNDCFDHGYKCVKQYGAECEEDCGGIFLCSNNTCGCPPNTHLARNKISCIEDTRDIGGNCTIDSSCDIPNSECTNEKCRCKQYYFEQNKQCVPGLGANCSVTKCQATNSICGSTGHCVCLPKFIFSSTDRCVPIRSYGEPCEEDEQCSCLFDKKCKLDQTYTDIVCLNKQCKCPLGHHYAFRRTACVQDRGIGEQCDEDANCEKILFAKCYNKKCECQENYFVSNNQCKQGIGSFCLSDSKCSAVANAKCVRNECKCVEEYVKQSTELCVPVSSFGKQCEYIEQCTAHTSNSTCEGTKDGTKICKCGAGQHHHGSGCFVTKVLDQQCDSNSECFVASKYDSVACLGNKCACVDGFVKVNDTYCDGAGSIISSVLLIVSMAIFAL